MLSMFSKLNKLLFWMLSKLLFWFFTIEHVWILSKLSFWILSKLWCCRVVWWSCWRLWRTGSWPSGCWISTTPWTTTSSGSSFSHLDWGVEKGEWEATVLGGGGRGASPIFSHLKWIFKFWIKTLSAVIPAKLYSFRLERYKNNLGPVTSSAEGGPSGHVTRSAEGSGHVTRSPDLSPTTSSQLEPEKSKTHSPNLASLTGKHRVKVSKRKRKMSSELLGSFYWYCVVCRAHWVSTLCTPHSIL